MKKKLGILSATAALILFLLISQVLGLLLMPVRSDYGCVWGSFLQEPKNSVDAVFLGSSVSYCDIIPSSIWEETGLSSFGMAGPEQTMSITYYYLRELCKTQSPKIAALDMTGMFFDKYQNYTKSNIGYMPIGVNRLLATLYAAEPEERLGLLFPLYSYHFRWKDVRPGELLSRISPPENLTAGYTLLKESRTPERVQRNYSTETEDYQVNLNYLGRIAEFCEKCGITLFCYLSPLLVDIPPAAYEDLMTDAAELGIKVVDFNAFTEAMGIDDNKDWYDFMHFNLYGADKFSRYLAGYLSENYELPETDVNLELWSRRAEFIRTALGKT